ncbi:MULTISPECIES: amino acid ABC transporter ATP-binding protein [Kocuria]|uniref:amino acid ABC transporter ATP-binding protein n=1 Tax=Kocuria TaxID=57493 RepID=UPI0008A21D4E|nr:MULTISPECIES: amino acid ABC transporter ATP-binding protein [Kocuria]MCG7424351.1 amino acid ABC transporter ATP-binding protein [Kocuria rhizophila]MCT1456107.1 amino acid ABC transporter ATP-binding protein [Kocuria rhizophila]MCT1879215.1 amino acid ABC transporter ATP-binding protein [Kocuria rhizophila]MCT2249022.1 amino acid ABC transporter ATP-binding protein [Kocuria rhizophila]OFK06172.1 arginine ABC transporter ATP-binding protein [Kocuria sp. HMSC066H03]
MLELRDVSKSFGDTPVLKDISLSLRDGETTVVLGPSGSGKSTLLRTMNLLEIPESGSLSINGDSVTFGGTLTRKQVSAIRRRSAMVFQGYNLFPHQSVRDNVAVPPVLNGKTDRAAARVRAEELLDKVGMAHRLDEYPDNLSGGQQQRVAIARALAVEPDYLLFDEPTSALDPELEAEVIKVMVELARERRSLVVVTHNIGFARRVADRIVFLADGGVGFDGTPEDFFASGNERIRRYLNVFDAV